MTHFLFGSEESTPTEIIGYYALERWMSLVILCCRKTSNSISLTLNPWSQITHKPPTTDLYGFLHRARWWIIDGPAPGAISVKLKKLPGEMPELEELCSKASGARVIVRGCGWRVCLLSPGAGEADGLWRLWSRDSVPVPPPCRCSVHRHLELSCTPATPPLAGWSAYSRTGAIKKSPAEYSPAVKVMSQSRNCTAVVCSWQWHHRVSELSAHLTIKSVYFPGWNKFLNTSTITQRPVPLLEVTLRDANKPDLWRLYPLFITPNGLHSSRLWSLKDIKICITVPCNVLECSGSSC